MLFNSTHFCVFFPIVVAVFAMAPKQWRWLILLVASYYFYMCWKPAYALLIFGSTIVDYFAAIQISRSTSRGPRRFYLGLSLLMNLGVLFLFKYLGFATQTIQAIADQFNAGISLPTLDLLLPVGISFYTFQTLSYSIDVYLGKVAPEQHFGRFALYVSFFPQLVAGPIERSSRLLPQIQNLTLPADANLAAAVEKILWGFFKKLVVADRVAIVVNAIYNNYESCNGTTLLIGTVLFAFQIYCDFSGYSDIAIGCAKFFGIDLMENFRRPYFAGSVQEFWRRWHISLSTWFRDYVYLPLGGSRVSIFRWAFNVLTVFIVSGIWHGANWTFVVWGALHGGALVASRFLPKFSTQPGRYSGFVSRLLSVGLTFAFVCLAWVFFRAESVSDACSILYKISTDLGVPQIRVGIFQVGHAVLAVGLLVILECIIESGVSLPAFLQSDKFPFIQLRQAVLACMILNLGVFDGSQFIYFQF